MTAIEAPERSLDQRMDALKKANVIRVARAQLKRDLKAGRVSVTDVLLDPPGYLATAKVFDVLLACPKFGRVKVNGLLRHCRVSPSKTMSGLSKRQRAELLRLVRRPVPYGAPSGPPPPRSARVIDPSAQHMRALGNANDVRLARARLKARIETGKTTVEIVLNDIPSEAASMGIADLLMTQYRWGRTRSRRLLAAISLAETKEIGSMTEWQRSAVIAAMKGERVPDRFACALVGASRHVDIEPADRAAEPVRVVVIASSLKLHLRREGATETLCALPVRRLWSPGLHGEWAEGRDERCRNCRLVADDLDAVIDDV